MQKLFIAIPLLALGMFAGTSSSQAQTSSTPATSAKSQPTKPKTATAARHHTATAAKSHALSLTTQKQKFSYALGMNLGTGMHEQSVEVDPEIVARGMKDAISGAKPLLTEDEARQVMMEVRTQVQKAQQAKMQLEAATNKKEGAAFLAANKSKPGVVTLPSGLQYKIITAGTGPKPTASDTVVCNYRGTLINGKEFDSSYKRGQPATFPLNGVIKGWTEALQLMPVGSKWQLFIPSDLAYGERSPSPDLGPDSTLIFEVELLSIQSKDAGNKTPQP
ncbi:MAG TPA: FKBP-type peptidyl-prolyl cis-trans isomerase [Terriglobales bacterium]|nr:FKBP-type peptidyl-prolyl cis-trans isomerase [Terriglobales bacterium]